MLPTGADAVIMLESTQLVRNSSESSGTIESKEYSEIEILHSVAKGENVLHIGEDVGSGQVVITGGTRIRPAEIGGCMALGITELNVTKKPKIGIISSGDEVISPQMQPLLGQVRDINTYSLAALFSQAGGEPVIYGIVPDNINVLKNVSVKALAECDMVVITAGSSASARDITSGVIASLGKPGILVHGINVRPGKPTILAVCDGKSVFGLPGNPVSALVIAGLFVVPVIERLLGAKAKMKPSVLAKLTVNIPSQAGREDWVAVKLLDNGEWENDTIHYMAEPVFGKSNLIFTLAKADGLIRIPPDTTGIGAGEVVEVLIL